MSSRRAPGEGVDMGVKGHLIGAPESVDMMGVIRQPKVELLGVSAAEQAAPDFFIGVRA